VGEVAEVAEVVEVVFTTNGAELIIKGCDILLLPSGDQFIKIPTSAVIVLFTLRMLEKVLYSPESKIFALLGII
jgi:hypothetical protein